MVLVAQEDNIMKKLILLPLLLLTACNGEIATPNNNTKLKWLDNAKAITVYHNDNFTNYLSSYYDTDNEKHILKYCIESNILLIDYSTKHYFQEWERYIVSFVNCSYSILWQD